MRSGRIVYTNDLPIYAAFDAGAVVYPGTLAADVPARLNARLLAGELDLSPISAFAYLQHADELVLLPELCIASRDEVISVVLVSALPPEQLAGATITVSNESASGRNLLRVLLERRFHASAVFAESDAALAAALAGRPTLVIGDGAVDARMFAPPDHVYDLGRLWSEWTGLNMVYAVWAARRDAYARDPEGIERALQALRESYAWARGNMPAVVAAAQALQPRPPHFYERYYGVLKFDFDEFAQAGLRRFAAELAAIGALDRVPALIPEVRGGARFAS